MEQAHPGRTDAAIILPIIALILPPLAVFAPLGTAPVLAVGAVAMLALRGRDLVAALRSWMPLLTLLLLLGLWATASAAWSILPGHSLFEGLRFTAISAAGLVMIAGSARGAPAIYNRLAWALIVGMLLALASLALERYGNAPITHLWLDAPSDEAIGLSRFDRGVTVLVLMLWPALFATPSKLARAFLIIAAVAIAQALVSAAALLALLTSLGVFAVAFFFPRMVAAAMILGVVALGVAIPWATPQDATILALHERAPWIKWSGIHRLVIWRFAADRVAERPLLGWGMDASRAMPGGKTDISTVLPTLHYPSGAELLPLHPHDAMLELRLELGVPGLLLGFAIIGWVLFVLGWRARLVRGRRAAALALSAAVLTVGMLSFGLWQAWWLSTVWLVAALYSGATPINQIEN